VLGEKFLYAAECGVGVCHMFPDSERYDPVEETERFIATRGDVVNSEIKLVVRHSRPRFVIPNVNSHDVAVKRVGKYLAGMAPSATDLQHAHATDADLLVEAGEISNRSSAQTVVVLRRHDVPNRSDGPLAVFVLK
jgi:hypothetical protein